METAGESANVDRRIKELEAQLKEQELRDKRSPRALIAQSFLSSLPIVLTVGLGFIANYVQSRDQYDKQLKVIEAQGAMDRGKQKANADEAEQARKEEADRMFRLQAGEAKAKLEQQQREFAANATMAQYRFAQDQSTQRNQTAAQRAQQSREFEQSLERQRRQNEADLVLQVIKVGDLTVARSNIDFLLQAGLVRDPGGQIAQAAKERPPVLPTASGALEVRIPDTASAEGTALVDRLSSQLATARPSRLDRRRPIGALIDAISKERDKYSVRELAVMMAVIENETAGSFLPREERCNAAYLRAFGKMNAPADLSQEACFEYIYGRSLSRGRGLGNREPGDGYRYRGRGYLLVTGRGNYERLSRVWSTDYVANPDLLQQPVHAFRAVLTYSEAGLQQLRSNPAFAEPDPAKFPFATAVTPVIRRVSGRAPSDTVSKIAKRAAEIETALRDTLKTL